MAELGLLSLITPKEFGGLGQNHVGAAMVVETIARYGCPSTAMVYSMYNFFKLHFSKYSCLNYLRLYSFNFSIIIILNYLVFKFIMIHLIKEYISMKL